ncbi:MAG: UvrB/UvrC motif-containing protein [Planctomycetota bacterium]|jgi:protein arginine kinase activator
MECENCHSAPAKVHMTEIVNENEKRERHLCEECAEKLGLTVKHYSLSELLAGIAAGQLSQKGEGVPDVTCPSCRMTFAEFQGAGRFGCADDYEAFGELVLPRLERFHDSTQHVGKSPRTGESTRSQAGYLRSLRAQLKEAVSQEAYERAAKLRDEIRKLEETPPAEE